MARRGLEEDGSIADLPWASVFDPAGNARALGAIQARGFRAATEVVERLVGMADGNIGPADRVAAPESEASRNESGRRARHPDVDGMIASWESMAGQLVRSLRGAGRDADRAAATLDVEHDDARGEVRLVVGQDDRAAAEVWLHNGGPTDQGEVGLRCSDLLGHDGTVIESKVVRFDPDVVPVPARSSRGICVEVVTAQALPVGTYRGVILADGHPDLWLPVVLSVPAAAP